MSFDKIKNKLGFGCMRFPEYTEGEKKFVDQEKVDEMIAYAYQNGVNYFDTAPYYCNSNSEAALGHAVKNFRDQILLSTKCPIDKGMGADGYRKHLERSLTRLGTDHIDFYHFWACNRGSFDDIIVPEGLLEAAAKAKEEQEQQERERLNEQRRLRQRAHLNIDKTITELYY